MMSQPNGLRPYVFPVADLRYALAWAEMAPGRWIAAVGAADDGSEYIAITPPSGAAVAIFLSFDDGEVVVVAAEVTSLDEIGRYATLRDALLALCTLDPVQHSRIERILSRPMLPQLGLS